MSIPCICCELTNPTIYFSRQLIGFNTFLAGYDLNYIGSSGGSAMGRSTTGAGVYLVRGYGKTTTPTFSGTMTLGGVGNGPSSESFSGGPPDGVNVFEWTPEAVICVASTEFDAAITTGLGDMYYEYVNAEMSSGQLASFVGDCLTKIASAKAAAFAAFVYEPTSSTYVNWYGFKDCAMDEETISVSGGASPRPQWLVFNLLGGTDQQFGGITYYYQDNSGTSPHSGLIGVFGDFSQFDGSIHLMAAQNPAYMDHSPDADGAAYPGAFGSWLPRGNAFVADFGSGASSQPLLNGPFSFALYQPGGLGQARGTVGDGTGEIGQSMGMINFALSQVSAVTQKYLFVTWVIMADMVTVIRPTTREFSAPGSPTTVEIPIPDIVTTFPATGATGDPQSGNSYAGDLFLASPAAISLGSGYFGTYGSSTLPAGLITVMWLGLDSADWVAAGSPFLPTPI